MSVCSDNPSSHGEEDIWSEAGDHVDEEKNNKVSFDDEDDDDHAEERSTTHGDSSTDRSSEDKEKFTQSETRKVLILRILVVLVIFLAAVAVSFVVYTITKQGETEEFESQFEGAASKVLETFEGILTQKLDAVASLAVAATAHGVDHAREWPLVTLSAFQERSLAARKASGTLFNSIVPLVTYEKRLEYENYTRHDEDGWMEEALVFQKEWDTLKLGVSLPVDPEGIHPGYITQDDFELGLIRDEGYGPYFPVWETSPLLKRLVNFNLGSLPQWLLEIETSMKEGAMVIGRMQTPPAGNALHSGFLTRFFATLLSIKRGKSVDYEGDPMSYVFFPIFDSWEEDRKAIAVIYTVINWGLYFEGILPVGTPGVKMVIENGCDRPATYTIEGGNKVTFDGEGDLHSNTFDYLERTTSFTNKTDTQEVSFALASSRCPYSIRVFPAQSFHDYYYTSTPVTITLSVAAVFVFTAFMFYLYDRLVERRQQLVLRKAVKSSEILASLFPKNIRDRLMEDAEREKEKKKTEFMAPNHRLKSFFNGDEKSKEDMGAQPIADLFPYTTVLFADISGFTAWSSTREPSQVFVLLQTLYQAFDEIAKRRRVFKVETIGDSYVAVTGLPQPQEKHAVIMARFAVDCLMKMKQVTRKLEVTLGPDTGDLAMRFGLHSGPVTAGVLRGDRSRFQLFGDTVNTAARMESTGARNKIQISAETARLLIAANKGHWVVPREDNVVAKGKGVMNTYWLLPKNDKGTSITSGSSDPSGSAALDEPHTPEQVLEKQEMKKRDSIVKQERLVDWVVEILKHYIREILKQRKARTGKTRGHLTGDFDFSKHGSNLEEIVEVISLPDFHEKAAAKAQTFKDIEIDEVVTEQLRNYVSIIASCYRDENPFHNFQHACHVTMAVNKFMQRIVAPDLDVIDLERAKKNSRDFASQLHDYTHGITSDPLTLCAIVWSALIHDVDHRGVSNVQLAKEDEQMATLYENKSIAEQNSLDVSWSLLTSADFRELRQCLFADESEFRRFRQVVVNVVLATDIFDKELNDLRKARWEKAFSKQTDGETVEDRDGLRATIVIEHIIQASDVAHTMQHWHVYRKWNQRLFRELTLAYKAGRMGADPKTFWYKGELGFFDNYILPLAKKLKDCNVFGVSSDECLNYARANREEWEARGQGIVEEMVIEMEMEEKRAAVAEETGTPVLEDGNESVST